MQLEECGIKVKDEAAKNPRDDERLSALMKEYCELDDAVKKLTNVKKDFTDMMEGILEKVRSS